uniref:Uncharacterized protein n=1 Tax=Anopheles farauti TaxID=69004 RepID=A0A182QS66_9DIPT
MSATMRTTLQTVPESLPADHITNSGAPVQCAAQMEPKSHSHSNSAGNKSIRSSTSRALITMKRKVRTVLMSCKLFFFNYRPVILYTLGWDGSVKYAEKGRGLNLQPQPNTENSP